MSRTSFATLLLLVAVAGAARADCADHAAEIQTLGEQLTQCTAVYGQNFPQTCPCYLPYTAKMHAIGCVDQASVDAVRKLCVNPSESFVAVAQKPAHREASPCSDPSVIDPIKKDLNSCTAIYGNNFPATCPCYEPYVQSLFKLGCVDQASVDNVKKLCVGSGDSTATVEAPKCSDQAAIEAAGKKLTACTAIYGNNFPTTCPCYEPYVHSLYELGCVDEASVKAVNSMCPVTPTRRNVEPNAPFPKGNDPFPRA